MKSILSIFGAFFFSIFVEGFIRVIISFYHQEEFSLFGTNALPGIEWILILIASVFITYWLASMLIVTINTYSPSKHLIAFTILAILWRLNELLQTNETLNLFYYFGITVSVCSAIILAAFLKKHIDANHST